jgi:hypothetical protein
MRFAYLSLDVDNQRLAERLAEAAGVTLDVQAGRAAAPALAFDAVLCDLDCLPADERECLVADLLAGRRAGPVAVHCRHLTAEQEQALWHEGVCLFRHLEANVFQALCRTVAHNQAAADLHAAF